MRLPNFPRILASMWNSIQSTKLCLCRSMISWMRDLFESFSKLKIFNERLFSNGEGPFGNHILFAEPYGFPDSLELPYSIVSAGSVLVSRAVCCFLLLRALTWMYQGNYPELQTAYWIHWIQWVLLEKVSVWIKVKLTDKMLKYVRLQEVQLVTCSSGSNKPELN